MNKDKIYAVSDEEFINIVKNSNSISEISRKLGFAHKPGERSTARIRERIKTLNLEIKQKKQISKTEIADAISKTNTMAEAARYMNISIKIFKRLAIKYNLWNPNQGKKGITTDTTSPIVFKRNKETFLKRLCKNSKMTTSFLRSRLIKYGFKENICEKCKLSKWNGLEIPLDVHHVDGDNKNNELKNLVILCPNCHRQTDNFGSKNKK